MPWRTASATDCWPGPSWRADRACPARPPREASPPPEHPLAPGVDVGHRQRGDEDEHGAEDRTAHQPRQTVLLVGDRGPGIQEQELDVEDEEEDGRQVELDVEALASVAD